MIENSELYRYEVVIKNLRKAKGGNWLGKISISFFPWYSPFKYKSDDKTYPKPAKGALTNVVIILIA
jgi:hypothetical protein